MRERTSRRWSSRKALILQVSSYDRCLPVTGHENMGEFDQLDEYIHAADAEALAALTARLDVEARLQQVLQRAEELERKARIPDDNR